MTLAIDDIVDGCGLSNKVRREFLPKKVMLYWQFISQKKHLTGFTLRWNAVVSKVGVSSSSESFKRILAGF